MEDADQVPRGQFWGHDDRGSEEPGQSQTNADGIGASSKRRHRNKPRADTGKWVHDKFQAQFEEPATSSRRSTRKKNNTQSIDDQVDGLSLRDSASSPTRRPGSPYKPRLDNSRGKTQHNRKRNRNRNRKSNAYEKEALNRNVGKDGTLGSTEESAVFPQGSSDPPDSHKASVEQNHAAEQSASIKSEPPTGGDLDLQSIESKTEDSARAPRLSAEEEEVHSWADSVAATPHANAQSIHASVSSEHTQNRNRRKSTGPRARGGYSRSNRAKSDQSKSYPGTHVSNPTNSVDSGTSAAGSVLTGSDMHPILTTSGQMVYMDSSGQLLSSPVDYGTPMDYSGYYPTQQPMYYAPPNGYQGNDILYGTTYYPTALPSSPVPHIPFKREVKKIEIKPPPQVAKVQVKIPPTEESLDEPPEELSSAKSLDGASLVSKHERVESKRRINSAK